MLILTALALANPATATQAPAVTPTVSGEIVSKVGNITPVNLLASTDRYAFDKVNTECCGPYSQCKCPDFKGAAD
ncbi:MAG: hypothetical protein HGB20_05925 [Chlorobiaceae bacterium]|jgi:hypothetical protein|nr:hypothetical protein [Chlorobiaceae bacterium]